MTENIENLILEHLKAFQAGQNHVESELKEIKNRLANLEVGQASMLQYIGHRASVSAGQQVAYDRL